MMLVIAWATRGQAGLVTQDQVVLRTMALGAQLMTAQVVHVIQVRVAPNTLDLVAQLMTAQVVLDTSAQADRLILAREDLLMMALEDPAIQVPVEQEHAVPQFAGRNSGATRRNQ